MRRSRWLLAWLLVPVIAATAASTPPPVLAQAATPATTVGGDWTQFHNDLAHSGYNAAETTISAANVANLGVAWSATTGDSIYSSPAVANGVVYVGSHDGKLYAYAVGCASGGGTCTPLWTATTGVGIFSSPAVANGVVYIGSGDHKLYAYSLSGLSGATYPALTPARILDSRDHTGGLGTFSSHVAQTFTVTGHGGVPANATAVTGNVTVTGQTSGGFLSIGPVAQNNPTSSTLNFPVGDDRANAVTVALCG